MRRDQLKWPKIMKINEVGRTNKPTCNQSRWCLVTKTSLIRCYAHFTCIHLRIETSHSRCRFLCPPTRSDLFLAKWSKSVFLRLLSKPQKSGAAIVSPSPHTGGLILFVAFLFCTTVMHSYFDLEFAAQISIVFIDVEIFFWNALRHPSHQKEPFSRRHRSAWARTTTKRDL